MYVCAKKSPCEYAHLRTCPNVAFEFYIGTILSVWLIMAVFDPFKFSHQSPLSVGLFPPRSQQFDVLSFVFIGSLSNSSIHRSEKASHVWWFLCPAVCLLSYLDFSMSIIVDPQEFLKTDVEHWRRSVWTFCSTWLFGVLTSWLNLWK